MAHAASLHSPRDGPAWGGKGIKKRQTPPQKLASGHLGSWMRNFSTLEA